MIEHGSSVTTITDKVTPNTISSPQCNQYTSKTFRQLFMCPHKQAIRYQTFNLTFSNRFSELLITFRTKKISNYRLINVL